MTEPDVALTDYALATECAVVVRLLHRRGHAAAPLRAPLLLFFGSIGVASVAGGTAHGFFADARTVGHAVLWVVVLIAIGATAWSAWVIGARILFPAATAGRVSMAAAAAFAGYCVVALFVARDFRVAVIFYLPAAVFLLTALGLAYVRVRDRRILAAVSGLGFTFVAAAVQQSGLALHPRYFDHNALYHLIQAVALGLLFIGIPAVPPRGIGANAPC